MGNLIVFKKGKNPTRTRVMLSAHMDEVGFIINFITEEGFLKFANIGGIDSNVLCGKSIQVGKNNIPGVIGAKPVHLLKPAEKEKVVPVEDLYIDIGAIDKKDAEKYINLGDYASFYSPFEITENIVKSKALDDRIGCAILIDLIKKEIDFDLTFAFLVQEEVGLRGAKTAAYKINPQAAIVLDATTAADILDTPKGREVCALGEGPVISYMDKSTIYYKNYIKLAQDLSKNLNLKMQIKKAVAGGNDSGAIHCTRSGVKTLSVSLPCRYLHSAVSIINLQDIFYTRKLVENLAFEISKRDYKEI